MMRRMRAETARLDGRRRPSGLWILAGIVVIGLLSGAGLFHSRRSAANAALAEREKQRAAAPHGPEERLVLWAQFGAPQIHHRLAEVARFSPERPWLVTHAVADPAGGDPELWGIDCTELDPERLTRVEGLTAVVELPHPRALGRVALSKGMAEHVPVFAANTPVDAEQRLRDLALALLEGMPRALESDIEGAHLEIRIAPQ
jgi:hypothetical protein